MRPAALEDPRLPTKRLRPEDDEDVSVVTSNRKALHLYHIIETFEAGMALVGTEVKSLRERKASLVDAYAAFDDNELYLHKMHIPIYKQADKFNHEPTRKRKLLMHKQQIKRLAAKTREKGLTLVPLTIYFRGPYAKVELALARGKRAYDKREAIEKRDRERDMQRAIKERRGH
jgi:SsrA-binding protein